MKIKKITQSFTFLALFWSMSAVAGPFDLGGGLGRMGTALQDNSGMQNPSIGIQFHVPVDDPSNWNAKVMVPKSANNPCGKPGDLPGTNYAYSNKSNPCFIPPSSK